MCVYMCTPPKYWSDYPRPVHLVLQVPLPTADAQTLATCARACREDAALPVQSAVSGSEAAIENHNPVIRVFWFGFFVVVGSL